MDLCSGFLVHPPKELITKASITTTTIYTQYLTFATNLFMEIKHLNDNGISCYIQQSYEVLC